MLPFIPRDTPALGVMLADMGNPPPAAIAKALHVSTATVRRWLAADCAPRPVMLSLYWVTRWGRSEVDCRAVNDARQAWGMVSCLEGEAKGLRSRIAYLESVARFGSANGPLYASEVRSPVPLPLDPVAQSWKRPHDGRREDRAAHDEQRLPADVRGLG